MVERENPEGGGGHYPNTSDTRLEVHRLLALFLSSKAFSDLRSPSLVKEFDPIYRIQLVEKDEITRLLLNLAITARVVDDREGQFQLAGANCGELEPDVAFPAITKILDLREACNKIIHAKKVHLDFEENGKKTYLNPFIYLYGEHNRKSWRATLDIVAFAEEYVNVVTDRIY